jgi:hypothetical protein
MSDEQQDAIIGRVLREYKDADLKLKALLSEAINFGCAMSEMATLLTTNPQDLTFEGEPVGLQHITSRAKLFKKSALPSVDTLVALTNDIRNTHQDVSRLKDQAAGLGFHQK